MPVADWTASLVVAHLAFPSLMLGSNPAYNIVWEELKPVLNSAKIYVHWQIDSVQFKGTG